MYLNNTITYYLSYLLDLYDYRNPCFVIPVVMTDHLLLMYHGLMAELVTHQMDL